MATVTHVCHPELILVSIFPGSFRGSFPLPSYSPQYFPPSFIFPPSHFLISLYFLPSLPPLSICICLVTVFLCLAYFPVTSTWIQGYTSLFQTFTITVTTNYHCCILQESEKRGFCLSLYATFSYCSGTLSLNFCKIMPLTCTKSYYLSQHV